MLPGLRHHPLVGRDHQNHQVDSAHARQHVAHEALVARHVDQSHGRRVADRQLGKAQVDRDPAQALLFQPIGVDSGQGADQLGLAVVDVAGRSGDDEAVRLRQIASLPCGSQSEAGPASGRPKSRPSIIR